MKELSLNILDITENSVKAGATFIEILLTQSANKLIFEIKDNGCGMSKETVESVMNPFYTTRTTRKVGMGIPLLKLACEQTGGKIEVVSDTTKENHGTTVTAFFFTNHVDFTPLGDVVSSVTTLIQGNPDIDFLFRHLTDKGEVFLDTREMREILGDVPINSYEVIKWIEETLNEQYFEIR